MSRTLWMKFAEDTGLPAWLSPEEQARLAAMFDAGNPGSEWTRAMKTLGLSASRQDQHLRWVNDAPYINWSALVETISAGNVQVVQGEAGGYGYEARKSLGAILKLVWLQWRLGIYLERTLRGETAPPDRQQEALVQSLALGLALVALTMRLPAHTPEQLAAWLIDPKALPGSGRAAIREIRSVQQRRTHLSWAWHEAFPPRDAEAPQSAPPHFWDEPQNFAATDISTTAETQSSWKGLPVGGGMVSGRAVLIERGTVLPETADPLILIFPQARPETVEWFGRAAAILYAEGGVLSHACTVAREQGVVCVTALGRGLVLAVRETESLWLRVDGQTGAVERL